MASKAVCPICRKRRAERYCPAMGEKICAVDCGREREVTIDCPSDCAYLVAAHRWEQSHPRSVTAEQMPFPDLELSDELIHTRPEVLSGLAYTVLAYTADQRLLTDAEVFSALTAFAEAYRTLDAGIYYEKPPQDPTAAGLYEAFTKFIAEEKKRAAENPGYPPLKITETFHLLVIFLRLGWMHSNGRPHTRGFIQYLRSQFRPELSPAKEESRIIVP